MLFTSLEFIFCYLPIVLAGFVASFRAFGQKGATVWLAFASLFFYGWWSAAYVPLLLGSILFNYVSGRAIDGCRAVYPLRARWVLAVAVSCNLALLGYFKYANFFLSTISVVTERPVPILHIVLPLGISFFTFTQIAFLVDAWKGRAREPNFWSYLLFVTWFPHLIAGPVLHHGQMMPQFKNPLTYKIRSRNAAYGVVLFVIGLAKKLLIADPISNYAAPVFQAAASGQTLGFQSAWTGAIAYGFQLYFDFSGYSDMAVALSMLFGVRLPINFDSPYKSTSIAEFWRRWHMTLSQFLRDYLYIPLGGNRYGEVRRFVNLMTTMLLGGLWHGANWTFVIWGGLHGAYLCLNHGYAKIPVRWRVGTYLPKAIVRVVSITVTWIAVTVAWVYFRADSVHAANSMIASMAGFVDGPAWHTIFEGHRRSVFVGAVSACFAVVWFMPNSQQIVEWIFLREHKLPARMRLIGMHALAFVCAMVLAVSIFTTFGATVDTPFLYFQF
ncbi:MBOAT family O-acyltransferase [Ralstonia wenshanensis]|uniref:MBOAT family O-acyltransferase n=1 Tax=Ralstonia wenshanensis TaxID=2842456 RepID=UPI0039C65F90